MLVGQRYYEISFYDALGRDTRTPLLQVEGFMSKANEATPGLHLLSPWRILPKTLRVNLAMGSLKPGLAIATSFVAQGEYIFVTMPQNSKFFSPIICSNPPAIVQYRKWDEAGAKLYDKVKRHTEATELRKKHCPVQAMVSQGCK